MPDEENEQTEQEQKTEEETKKEEKQDWDKERQRIEQAEANVRKLTDERDGLNTQLSSVTEDLASAKEQQTETTDRLAKLEEQIKEKAEQTEGDDIDNLDPDLNDPKLIKAVQGLRVKQLALEKQLSEKDKSIDDLQKARDALETNQKKQDEESDQAQRREKILTGLDGEFGEKFRNDAIKLANKKVKEEGESPRGELDTYLLIRKCYEEVAKKAPGDTTTKETVPVDTGLGGVTFKEGDVKDGYNEDVLPGIAKSIRGGIKLPSTD